jgi:hypothetical protein
LRHKGLDPEVEVSIVGLGRRYPRVLAMLAEGALDGAIISEPHVSMGEEAGWFNVWLGVCTENLIRIDCATESASSHRKLFSAVFITNYCRV